MRRTVEISTRRARAPTEAAPRADARKRARRLVVGTLCIACIAAAPFAYAQSQDKDGVPLPPRFESPPGQRSAPPPPSTVYRPLTIPSPTSAAVSDTGTRPPNAAHLAPLPEDRADKDQIEEIVVRGEGWRLPDLGSGWREKQEEADASDRPHVTWVPLYDPEHPTTFNDTWVLNRELSRIGYIDLFRFRFGKHSKTESDQ
jgi:hypothetical protein